MGSAQVNDAAWPDDRDDPKDAGWTMKDLLDRGEKCRASRAAEALRRWSSVTAARGVMSKSVQGSKGEHFLSVTEGGRREDDPQDDCAG